MDARPMYTESERRNGFILLEMSSITFHSVRSFSLLYQNLIQEHRNHDRNSKDDMESVMSMIAGYIDPAIVDD